MPSTTGVIMSSGALAFVGSFKEAGGFPENGYAIIGGTTALTFLGSTVQGTKVEGPVRMFAYLVLLTAALKYIPSITNIKDKKNG